MVFLKRLLMLAVLAGFVHSCNADNIEYYICNLTNEKIAFWLSHFWHPLRMEPKGSFMVGADWCARQGCNVIDLNKSKVYRATGDEDIEVKSSLSKTVKLPIDKGPQAVTFYITSGPQNKWIVSYKVGADSKCRAGKPLASSSKTERTAVK